MIIRVISFQSVHLYFPYPTAQFVHMLMIGGNIKASVELLTAPTSDMRALRFGTTSANATAIKKHSIA